MKNPAPGLTLHVIGAGLIGTSLALGARQAGYQVTISDVDERQERLAQNLLRTGNLVSDPSLVIVAIPPSSAAEVVCDALSLFPSSIVVDVTSTKTKVQQKVKLLSESWDRFVPSHPIAGREVGGASSAQADLFQGRAWIITPYEQTNSSQARIELVEELVKALGATSYVMTAAEHDRLFAGISHLPQVISTALASITAEVGDGAQLAGQGLRDMTRLAESDPLLWNEIFESNKEEILAALEKFEKRISEFRKAISQDNVGSINELFRQARVVREKISGKHGARRRNYTLFRIVVDDRAGVLAELFVLCGEHGINVEDLELEHSPSQETGLITLSVNPAQAEDLALALESSNWTFIREETPS